MKIISSHNKGVIGSTSSCIGILSITILHDLKLAHVHFFSSFGGYGGITVSVGSEKLVKSGGSLEEFHFKTHSTKLALSSMFNKNLLNESINKIFVSQHSMNQVKFGWSTMTELTHLILRIVPFGNMPTL